MLTLTIRHAKRIGNRIREYRYGAGVWSWRHVNGSSDFRNISAVYVPVEIVAAVAKHKKEISK